MRIFHFKITFVRLSKFHLIINVDRFVARDFFTILYVVYLNIRFWMFKWERLWSSLHRLHKMSGSTTQHMGCLPELVSMPGQPPRAMHYTNVGYVWKSFLAVSHPIYPSFYLNIMYKKFHYHKCWTRRFFTLSMSQISI